MAIVTDLGCTTPTSISRLCEAVVGLEEQSCCVHIEIGVLTVAERRCKVEVVIKQDFVSLSQHSVWQGFYLHESKLITTFVCIAATRDVVCFDRE